MVSPRSKLLAPSQPPLLSTLYPRLYPPFPKQGFPGEDLFKPSFRSGVILLDNLLPPSSRRSPSTHSHTSCPTLYSMLYPTPYPRLPKQAVPGDDLSKLSFRSGVPLEKILLDNLQVLKDISAPLEGKTLLVCGARTRNGSSRAWDPFLVDPYAPQMKALLEIKKAIDRTGALASWTEDRGTQGGYCSSYEGIGYLGVRCDADKNVIAITLFQQPLGGVLPPASALKALPRLQMLELSETNISGTLPADWSGVGSLVDVRVEGNTGVTGECLCVKTRERVYVYLRAFSEGRVAA